MSRDEPLASCCALAAELRSRICPHADAQGVAAALAFELAEAEPGDRPDPDDERARSWRIPGPGGHVRRYVALATAVSLVDEPPPPGTPPAEQLKRAWPYGSFLRCCDEEPPRRRHAALRQDPGPGSPRQA